MTQVNTQYFPATQILSPLVPGSCLTDWSKNWSEKPGPVAAAKQVLCHLADTADQLSPIGTCVAVMSTMHPRAMGENAL